MNWLNQTDRKLWRLALPMILSNISVPLLGLVDTLVMGHLSNELFLAGVAIGTTITSFIFMLFLFLRMGTTGPTAQAWGGQDRLGLAKCLLQPLIIALLVGTLLALFHHPLTLIILQLFGGNNEVQHQAQLFLDIRWLSAPATLANMVILGWLLGVQYASAPLILLVVSNTVNILLELLFVVHWHYAVQGAALATVIAEYLSLIIGLCLIRQVTRDRQITLAIPLAQLGAGLAKMLKLNRDILLRSLLLQLCFAVFTLIGARLGSEIVALNALLMVFLTFTAYALDGFAYAVESVTGEACGARNPSLLLATWHSACKQAGAVALLFSLIYLLAGQQLIDLLTSLSLLRNQAGHYLGWLILCPLVAVWCYLFDGLFVGATRGREMRNSMAVATLGYAASLCTVPLLGNHGLWLALLVFFALRGITLSYYWQKLRHQAS